MTSPNQAGYWWAFSRTHSSKPQLIVVDTDKSDGSLLMRLADAIHWPQPSKENPTRSLWFKPNRRWKNWEKVKE